MTATTPPTIPPTHTSSPVAQTTLKTPEMRRILASSFIGSAIEYYDFLLYATAAALVFGKVFFTHVPPGVALFASFATLAVGYVARPLGGLIFGHFGDRVGRKKMLVLSMLMMGAGTVCIGLLPTTAQIGIAAPIGLILLRLLQGVAVGGEWGGAALMAVEHAPAAKRGFAAGFVNAGGPAGSILATLVLSLFAAISGSQFLVWGWRVPFLLSAVLIGVGLVIRLKVSETPAFARLEAEQGKRRMPILDVLSTCRKPVLLGIAATMAFYVCQAMTTVWGVSVAVGNGADPNGVLNIKAVGAALTLVVTLYSARLSDRIGRRPVLMFAGVAGIVSVYPVLALMTNGTLWGFALAVLIGNGVVQGFLHGPIAAYVSEQFPTRIRYTGASTAYQFGSMLGAGFTPMIVEGLVLLMGGGTVLVGVFWIVILVVAVIAVRATPEGRGRELV